MDPTGSNAPMNLKKLETTFQLVGYKDGLSIFENHLKEWAYNQPWVVGFLREMQERYDKPRFTGSPSSDHNQERKDDASLNFFAPAINLKTMLKGDWFDVVSDNKERYTCAWREQVIDALMTSEYGKYMAEKWSLASQRQMLRGHVMGAMMKAGVIKGSALAVARTFYKKPKDDLSTEVKTLAKYMGDSRKEPYLDWIIKYMKSPIEKT